MKLKLTIVLLGILCLFTGCINEYENGCPDVNTSREPYTISFIFTSINSNTRGIEDPELEAVNYENQIDFNRTAFFLFSNTGNIGEHTFIAPLIPEEGGIISTSGFNISTWEVIAKISDADDKPLSLETMQNDGFKIVCVANMKNIPTPAVGDKLDDYLKTLFYEYASPKPATDWYTYPFAGYDDEDMLIPMYGVLTVAKDKTYHPNIKNYVGELCMLRAMSKIELTFTDNANKNLSIESASLNKYYPSGRVAPDGIYDETRHNWTDTDSKGNNQPNTLLNRPVYLPEPSPTKVEDAAVPFHRYVADGKCRRAVIYVPEYDNQTQKDLAITVKISSGGSSLKESSFEVCEYDDKGKIDNHYLPLARNYCITYKLNVDGKYVYVVQVGMQQWQTIDGAHEIYNW